MISSSVVSGLFGEFVNLLGLSAGIIAGYAAGRPLKKRIIRKYARRH